ncbi:DUF6361 family protein [Virgibacillus doumboii]|uniref:DUF6361 family protein n=1 Tax=Virgibacillus doumboii TaxID=2697503 RepID=UPI0013DFE03B|nr:DUF6361 family protein [Virgibacillus doumboii]
MNELKLGWIDYSSEHRDKVMAVLHALAAPSAMDELGIGLIRDGFADILFPGTSTIQTRAKYFLIVPYLLMELEKENYARPQDMIEKLGEEEISLIETLNKEGQSGVIGGRAGKTLKRKPANIYWNGLRTFEIFRHPSLSLDNYAKVVFRMKHNKDAAKIFGDEEHDSGHSDGEYSSTFWRCILPEQDWKDTVSMDLTYDEARFLKTKITTASRSKDSLFSYLLNEDFNEVTKINDFGALGDRFLFSGRLYEDYTLAKKFNQFISGANIRYNVIASNRENERAVAEWEKWMNSSFVKYEFQSFPYMQVIQRLDIKNLRLIKFLREWQEVALSGDDNAIDRLIIKREIELKSKDRAKLQNSKMYTYQDGDWIGSAKLQYRFTDAKTIMADIFAGLEGYYAETGR